MIVLMKHLRAVALLGLVLEISACGGRHTSSTQSTTSTSTQTPPVVLPTASVSNVFDGTLTDSGQALTAVLETDGSYYLVYSGSNQMPAGAIIGTGGETNGSYASSNAANLSLVGSGSQTPLAGTLGGSLSAGKSFSGTVTYGDAQTPPVAFSTTFNSAFTVLPAMSSLAGTYIGAIATRSLKEDKLELDISPDGKVTGKLSCGCTINATLSPRGDGTAYIVTLQFTGGDHPLTNKNMAGTVYYDAMKKRIYIVGNVSGTDGALFVGTKQ